MSDRLGTVYLIHLSPRYKHAGHYLGWAKDLDKRVGEHLRGHSHSSPLLKAALDSGCELTVARTWPDVDRHFERRLKNRGGAARLCPICQGGGA